MKKIIVLTAVAGLLSACMSVPNDATRLNINGFTIAVYPKEGYTKAILTSSHIRLDFLKLKKAQIEAVETVTGCKVTDSTRGGTAAILITEVTC